MSDKPGPSKRALKQLSAQVCVKVRRVEEIYEKNTDDEYYIVTNVSDSKISAQPLNPVKKQPITQHEQIELDEEDVTIKIEEPDSYDPLYLEVESKESSKLSRPGINVTQKEHVDKDIKEEPEQPPYLIELRKTLCMKKAIPPLFVRSSQNPSGPWTENDSSLMQDIEFTKKRSWLMPTPINATDYFDFFIEDDYLNGIVTATNKSVSQRKNRKHDSGFLRNWIDLTVAELKIFIGLLLHTGTGKHKLLSDYWREHRLYKTCFPGYMKAHRFTSILQYLSFPGFEAEKKMSHCRFNHHMADHFNSVMKKIYYPGRELTISVSKVSFDSPCDNEFPLKVFALHKLDEPIVKIIIDSRRKPDMDMEAVIGKLLEDKYRVGHAIYVNKVATTPIVPAYALHLLRYGTYCTGILDEKRFQVPDELNQVKLEAGESASVFNDGLHIGKHMFKEGATVYVTSEYKKDMNKPSNQIPEPLRVYREMTSDYDPHSDILNYSPWKTYTLSPVKKLFIYTLLTGIWNANKLCNMFSGTRHNYNAYRLCVLENLLPPLPEPPKQIKRSHKLVKIPKSAFRLIDGKKGVKFTARRDCKNCKNVKKIRNNTVYQCDGCDGNPAFCMKCFFELHSFESV